MLYIIRVRLLQGKRNASYVFNVCRQSLTNDFCASIKIVASLKFDYTDVFYCILKILSSKIISNVFFSQLHPVVIKPNRNGCFRQWRRDMRRNQNFLRACKQVLVCCSRSEVDKQSRERCKLAGVFSSVRCARRLLLRSPPPLLVLPSATKFFEFYTKISEYFRAYFRSL